MDNILEILKSTEVIIGMLTVLFGGGGGLGWKVFSLWQAKDQILKTVDKSELANEDFLKIAENDKLKAGIYELKKLLNKK